MGIVIVGSLSGQGLTDTERLARLLSADPVAMTHQGEFTGKPETKLYIDDDLVLKVNANRNFQSFDLTYRWCELQIAKEREYQIYHPDRTWVVLPGEGGYFAANVTPRLLPLHMVDFATLNPDRRVALLGMALGCYINFACDTHQRLDEGLSNFALYGERVVYLDDDIFLGGYVTPFVAMLANWLRKSEQLSLADGEWRCIGELLAPLLEGCSSDANDMVIGGLEDQFVGDSEGYKQALLHALRPNYAPATADAASALFSMDEKIGLLADVHANLPALEAVLAELDRRGIRQYLMLGDVVGYGPNPQACIELLRERDMHCLRGNHDHFVAHRGDVRVAMGIMARKIGEWTIEQLGDTERAWLGDLPVRLISDRWMAVHGAPVDQSFFNAYVYEVTAERNLEHLKGSDVRFCFHGHSHIQGIYALDGGQMLPFACPERARLGDYRAALVCPGAVGQARGGKIKADAAILDPVSLNVEMFSVPYDIDRLIADMEANGFPDALIERVRAGR